MHAQSVEQKCHSAYLSLGRLTKGQVNATCSQVCRIKAFGVYAFGVPGVPH